MLAAGAGTRYGGPKQAELLPAVLAALGRSPVDEIVVVSGAHPLRVDPAQARLEQCDEWGEGPGASLRCGLTALGPNVTHAVIVLADGPTLDPRSVARLVAHRDDAPVLAASYDGSRSHPVVLARAAWHAVPDEGGRALQAALVDCSDLQAPGDVDYRRS
ncbi:MAG: nucleotidyltransferase family protein [Gaiellaceae bacterium]